MQEEKKERKQIERKNLLYTKNKQTKVKENKN